MAGRFITFEGGEGGGKSTHAGLLAERLGKLGIEVVLTREPGGSPGAEILRHVILSGAAKPFGPDMETILFAAARGDHIRETITPALADGKWVICDRFLDSTRVYQGTLGNVDPRVIKGLERIIVADVMPDLTFIMDVPAEDGLARAARRRAGAQADRFESETVEFHETLRQTFAKLAELEPERCVLIDTTQPKPAVADKIWRAVESRFALASAARINEKVS